MTNKKSTIKDANCLNCNYPFTKDEKYCPDCGQKNQGKRIVFKNFIQEMFAGFLSWDAKFWRTLIPLLTNPGIVSKNYIEGKRARYTNPFRFYLAVSIIFFLIIKITDNYKEFNTLQKGDNTNSSFINGVQDAVKDDGKTKPIDTKDSIINTKESNDSPSKIQKKDNTYFSFAGNKIELEKMISFQKAHPKTTINSALDSLGLKKSFSNKFWYSRTRLINDLQTDKNNISKNLYNQLLSYASISLFIFLPIFTLFLSLLYFRKKYTYVENLIFVFHIQTVFFMLFSFFYIINFIQKKDSFIGIFILLFLIYLFIAMKKFYNQSYFKTTVKYCIANTIFFFLSILGIIIISLITFALY